LGLSTALCAFLSERNLAMSLPNASAPFVPQGMLCRAV
jgi:hypothetical protein